MDGPVEMTDSVAEILLIDDSPTVLCFAKLVLQEQGYGVHSAETGEQGLMLAKKLKPAAIFVDYVLPNMTGRSFCEIIRQDEELKNTPMILITSKGDDIASRLQSEFAGLHYLAKPFEPEDLQAVLELALNEDSDQ